MLGTRIGILSTVIIVSVAVSISLYALNGNNNLVLSKYQYFNKNANAWSVNQNTDVMNWIESHKTSATACIGDKTYQSCGDYWLYEDPRFSKLEVNLPICNSSQKIIWDFAYGKFFCVGKEYWGYEEEPITSIFRNQTTSLINNGSESQ